jgi:hypothetical protein
VNDKISDEEVFANAYHYFVEALKVLMADADTQCKRMGNYNVAWELKDDVSAGAYLLNLPAAPLTQEEKDGIVAMVEVLKELPASLLVSATTEAANKKAMTDPCWTALRARAAELLSLLAATTRRNEDFLARRKGQES